ncbi:hypothetical protein [Streptomyces showdoensis]|uniref:carbohydrate ABC transporter permease n=1 Tax=Streptomyces showdoensis TaxID=68268 RepID=UPI0031EFEC1F
MTQVAAPAAGPAPAAAAPRPAVPRRRRRGRAAPYLFVLPALLLFAAFKLYPIGWSFLLSLHRTVGGAETFVGADNYLRLAEDPLLWTALRNTLVILVVQVPLMLALATGLAVALDSTLLRGARSSGSASSCRWSPASSRTASSSPSCSTRTTAWSTGCSGASAPTRCRG